jgi:hypothetical protein
MKICKICGKKLTGFNKTGLCFDCHYLDIHIGKVLKIEKGFEYLKRRIFDEIETRKGK